MNLIAIGLSQNLLNSDVILISLLRRLDLRSVIHRLAFKMRQK